MVIFWVRKDGQNCVFVFGSGMVTRECRKKLLTFARCVHSMSVMGYFGCPVPLCCVFGQKKTPKLALLLFGMVWDLPCCCHCVLGCGLCHGEQSCGLCPSG